MNARNEGGSPRRKRASPLSRHQSRACHLRVLRFARRTTKKTETAYLIIYRLQSVSSTSRGPVDIKMSQVHVLTSEQGYQWVPLVVEQQLTYSLNLPQNCVYVTNSCFTNIVCSFCLPSQRDYH